MVGKRGSTHSVCSVHSVVQHSSCGESLVHFGDHAVHAVAEELVHFTEATLGVEGGGKVQQAGDDAGGFVEERQRLAGVLNPFQLRSGVVLRLVLDGGVFADGLVLSLVEVDGVFILNSPSRGAELCVKRVAGSLFRVLVEH